jgi:hypothetical protein
MQDFIIITPSLSGKIAHGRPCLNVVGVSSIVDARSELLARALREHPGKPQLWIDDDIDGVTDELITELFRVAEASGAGMVAAWYVRDDGVPVHSIQIGKQVDPSWVELVSCGFGCVLVMPKVWPHIGEPTIHQLRTRAGFVPNMFQQILSWDDTLLTEDFSFCSRVRFEGLKVVAANQACVTHLKRGKRLDINRAGLVFPETMTIETLVKRGPMNRECREVAWKSVQESDLTNITELYDSEGLGITNAFIRAMRRAAESTADVVLQLEDDAEVCPDIQSRILSWEPSWNGQPWRSQHFGAGSLCRITANEMAGPEYGFQAFLTTPVNAAKILEGVVPLVESHIGLDNRNLMHVLRERGEWVFDIQVWRFLKGQGMARVYPERSWARHLGGHNSSWLDEEADENDTPDYILDASADPGPSFSKNDRIRMLNALMDSQKQVEELTAKLALVSPPVPGS